MKSYDNDWYLRFNLSYEERGGARRLGVTFVIAQSRCFRCPTAR